MTTTAVTHPDCRHCEQPWLAHLITITTMAGGQPECPVTTADGPHTYEPGEPPPECESCHEPITDDAEAFDCTRYSGPVHVGCHPADCRSVECREAMSDPTEFADERD